MAAPGPVAHPQESESKLAQRFALGLSLLITSHARTAPARANILATFTLAGAMTE